MTKVGFVVGIIALMSIGSAGAQERPYTPALTCAAIKGIVAREHDVTLAVSQNAYEMIHDDSMACQSGETGTPAFEPASDDPNCLAGYRCKQRNNGGDR